MKNYYFIGDQGVSMRGLKEYMRILGYQVSGSDLKSGGHSSSNITSDIDVVVRTSAVTPGSPGFVEVLAAEKLNIPVIKRSVLLGQITKDKRLIAVSGMHGKTTVTSMVGDLLIKAKYDPTVLVGEDVPAYNGVLHYGRSDWFVAEVCEYDRSFLDVSPEILILTNIEEEHLDTYPGGLPEIIEAFVKYVEQVRPNGTIVACRDDKNIITVLEKAKTKAKIVYYGFNSDRFNRLDYQLSLSGKHNRQNALAVVALANQLNIGANILQEALATFQNAKRRFEYKGKHNGAPIIDDYGHHPTEIRSALESLSEKYPDKRKVVVFWPHQYKRIKPLLKAFSESFDKADELILKPIYFVPGRDEVLDVDSRDIADLINAKGQRARVLGSDKEIINYLKTVLDENSVLLTIGIPPVYKIAEALAVEKE